MLAVLQISVPISVLSFLFLLLRQTAAAPPIGLCYGRLANNLPPHSDVISLLKSNSISSIRLFNTDPSTLKSFSGTGISLMVGVPDEILPSLASENFVFSLQWLQTNIFNHIPPNQIRYIAVGNEILLKDSFYAPYVLPAMANLYQALQTLSLTDSIKLSSPQAASVLSSSYPPSSGTFDPKFISSMVPLLRFLHDTISPFMVNVYPYFSYISNSKYLPLDYALSGSDKNAVQDGPYMYNNLFDASVDAFVYAMEREGFAGIPVVVSETGWPTGGGEAASVENALAYNGNLVRKAASRIGTPKKPGEEVEVYLFGLFDENGKSGEEYEKHFGVFRVDGAKVYDINFQ